MDENDSIFAALKAANNPSRLYGDGDVTDYDEKPTFDTDAFLAGLDNIFERHAAQDEAADYLLQAMADAENAGDNAGLLTVLNETMGFYRSQSRHDDNQWIIQRALELGARMGIEGTEAWTTTLINAATAQRAAGNYEQAEDLYRQALAAAKHTYGPYDRRLAALHNNMSMLYSETDRPTLAYEELSTALEILKAASANSRTDPDIASTYTNLALVALDEATVAARDGQADQAAKLITSAKNAALTSLNIYREGHHEDSAHFASALAGYAQTCYAAGDFAQAVDAYRHALSVIAECYGKTTDYYHVTEANLRQAEQAAQNAAQNAAQQAVQNAAQQTGQSLQSDSATAASSNSSSQSSSITGLELAKAYWLKVVRPMLEERWPQLQGRIAAGLVGHGSECYGFDDTISRDHDFGPRVCLWLTDDDYAQYGERLQQDYDALPHEFMGFSAPLRSPRASGEGRRDGVFAIPEFFTAITGYASAPAQDHPHEWLMLDEATLAAATNGRIFADPIGVFSHTRQSFALMPDDVRLALMSRRLGMAAQAGQANLPRMLARGDGAAAMLCLTQFVQAVSSFIFLYNNPVTVGYLPYYKWQPAALRRLARRPGMRLTEVIRPLGELLEIASDACFSNNSGPARDRANTIIGNTCNAIVAELNRTGLSTSAETFLEWQRPYVESHIASDDAVLHSV